MYSCRNKSIQTLQPIPKDDAHRKWRKAWFGEILKTRVVDQDFKNQIKNDRVYTCEQHFSLDDIAEIFKYDFLAVDCRISLIDHTRSVKMAGIKTEVC